MSSKAIYLFQSFPAWSTNINPLTCGSLDWFSRKIHRKSPTFDGENPWFPGSILVRRRCQGAPVAPGSPVEAQTALSPGWQRWTASAPRRASWRCPAPCWDRAGTDPPPPRNSQYLGNSKRIPGKKEKDWRIVSTPKKKIEK